MPPSHPQPPGGSLVSLSNENKNREPPRTIEMIDFIFQVDLSSVYVILRRDFATAHEKNGTLTAPLSAGFFYTAAEANVSYAFASEVLGVPTLTILLILHKFENVLV